MIVTRKATFAIIILLVLLLFTALFKLPLAKISTSSSNSLYINNVLQNKAVVRTSVGWKTIASASPLHAKQSKSLIVLPFGSYAIEPYNSQLNVASILKQAGVSLGDNLVDSSTFFQSNKWLVVAIYSPLPDGGSYSVILAWRPYSGLWQKVAEYDGSNSAQLTNIVPLEVQRSLGL